MNWCRNMSRDIVLRLVITQKSLRKIVPPHGMVYSVNEKNSFGSTAAMFANASSGRVLSCCLRWCCTQIKDIHSATSRRSSQVNLGGICYRVAGVCYFTTSLGQVLLSLLFRTTSIWSRQRRIIQLG